MATSSVAVRQLSDGNSVGTVLGVSSADVIGFYGVTSGVAKSATNFATLSASSGALASSVAIFLGSLGLITCTSVAA